MLALALSLFTGCGDDSGKPVDAAIDAPAANTAYTGEVVDWDESETNFCGVFGAKLAVHGDAARADTTNPNGRFNLMIAAGASTQIDVVPPTEMSQCASGIGHYQLPGIMIIGDAVLATGKPSSYRMIGADRIAPFFSGLGATAYEPSKAIVFVHIEGTPAVAALTGMHDAPLAWSGSTWSKSNVGIDVVFPNVTPGMVVAGFQDLTNGIGGTMVPAIAGTITYVTLVDPS
ncbi:hypothetical protein BH11MYX1_BH11MYX1_15500 [soil metagenome]